MVVMPSMVKETSLTTVLVEPPPPDPELPPADCEDDVSDVAEVDEVDDVAAVADVDDVAEDDVADVVWDTEAAAADEAIELIDMKPSLEGKLVRNLGMPRRWRALLTPSTCRADQAGADTRKILAGACVSRGNISNQSPRHELQLLPTCHGRLTAICARHEWTVTLSHVRVSWSAAGEFSRASRDQ